MDWQRFRQRSHPITNVYSNYACVAVAANWPRFTGLYPGGNPATPRRSVQSEYAQIRKAFNLRIMPHIDANLLIKIRAMPWLSWANQQ